jgi:hypothetical protein
VELDAKFLRKTTGSEYTKEYHARLISNNTGRLSYRVISCQSLSMKFTGRPSRDAI